MRPHDEDALIQTLTGHWSKARLIAGVGHDCAVLRPLRPGHLPVIKTDSVVEGIHFLPSASPSDIGHKAIARVLSDFAASAATPLAVLIALGLPPGFSMKRLQRIYQGLEKTSAAFNVTPAGGEVTKSPVFWITVSGFGQVHPAHRTSRSGARAGDLIVVSGKLGATQPKHHLTFTPRLPEGQWLGAQRLATSMMDLSDGLGRDLPRLAHASGLSFVIHPDNLPLRPPATPHDAVNNGEDYELLFTIRPRNWARLTRSWPFSTPLTVIGSMQPAHHPADTGGLAFHGFDHLRA